MLRCLASKPRCPASSAPSPLRRIDHEMNASMSCFEAAMSHVERSISTSTRRSRDERLDVSLRSRDVPHRALHLDFDASIVPLSFYQTSFRGEGPVSLLEPPTLLFNEPGRR